MFGCGPRNVLEKCIDLALSFLQLFVYEGYTLFEQLLNVPEICFEKRLLISLKQEASSMIQQYRSMYLRTGDLSTVLKYYA